MDLTIPIQISTLSNPINYQDNILLMGSCFTEHIGDKLDELKFSVLQNPNGILYNPLIISSALNSYIENKTYKEDDLFSLNELWHSWHHHSIFSGMNKETVLQNINRSQTEAHLFLKNASWLIITLGTSYNYQLKDSLQHVANCHKAPKDFFESRPRSQQQAN